MIASCVSLDIVNEATNPIQTVIERGSSLTQICSLSQKLKHNENTIDFMPGRFFSMFAAGR
jgi:hypothetical protein